MRATSLAILIALGAPSPSEGQGPAVPNGSVTVAYRQLDDRKLSDSVHQVELSCWDDECSLTTLTLNQCMPFSKGTAFYPKVQQSSTAEGDLVVRALSDGVVEATEALAGTSLSYRFSYSSIAQPERAARLGTKRDIFFTGLRDFSGAAVRSSDVLQKVVAWELVPLRGASVLVEARCRILLDGIP